MTEKKSLQCPFTWNIDEKLTSQYDEDEELEISVNVQPVISLMKSIMITYAKTVQQNYKFAQDNLKKTDEIWHQITAYKNSEIEQDKISIDVLLHIKEATKLHVFKKINSPTANQILDNITNSTQFKSKIEIATLEGCKTIIWLNFHEYAFEKALFHAKLAYTDVPDCSLWNFLLGKSLRFSRRQSFSTDITRDEKKSYLSSYNLRPIPYYAISLAEMYRENGEINEAKKLHELVFNQNPSELCILLPMIKSFVSYKDFTKAKACLDLFEKFNPYNSAFLHYKGIYFEKQGYYKEAIKYLEQSVKNSKNFMAEMTYIRCMIKLHKRQFDYVGYLKKMVAKYDKSSYKQKILLDLAMCYYLKKKDIYNAGLYLLQSIQLDPENKLFKSYYSYDKKENINVLDFTNKELIPKLEKCNKFSNYDSLLKNLKDVCNTIDTSNLIYYQKLYRKLN